jgi:hypothetical protein
LKGLLDELVRPGTHPVAVKIFKEEPKNLPSTTVFPSSLPNRRIDDMIFGLETTNRLGTARYPTHFKGMQIEPTFPGKYKKLGDLLGMKIKEKRE